MRRGGGLPATLGPARRPCGRARHGLQHEEAGVGRGHLLHSGSAGEAWHGAAHGARMWSAPQTPCSRSPFPAAAAVRAGGSSGPCSLVPELPGGSSQPGQLHLPMTRTPVPGRLAVPVCTDSFAHCPARDMNDHWVVHTSLHQPPFLPRPRPRPGWQVEGHTKIPQSLLRASVSIPVQWAGWG